MKESPEDLAYALYTIYGPDVAYYIVKGVICERRHMEGNRGQDIVNNG